MRYSLTKVSALVALLAVLGGAWPREATSAVITNNPNLPPQSPFGRVAYLSPQDVHAMYTGMALQVVLSRVEHSFFRNITIEVMPPNERENFDSTVSGNASVNGGPDIPFSLDGPVSVVTYNKAGQTTGVFQTEMISMSLTGLIGGNPVMIRESPTLASTGVTSIQDIGGGLYRIDSFFNVFTELSLDGGASWIPSTGPVRVVAQVVPEPSTLLAAAVGAIGLAGYGWKRRRAGKA